MDFDKSGITFTNIEFDDDYNKILDTKKSSDNAELAERIFEEGEAAEDEEDYATAMKKYRQAADMNYVPAFAAIGELYEYGDGVDENLEEAKRWYQRGIE